MILSHLTISY